MSPVHLRGQDSSRTAAEMPGVCFHFFSPSFSSFSPSNASLICNGRGSCQCGKCQCKSGVSSGEFCECDSSSCPTGPSGNMCSGNGACECGKCVCEQGWEREDCSCPADKTTCLEGGVECSNQGHCECGRCVCDGGFTGAYCGAKDEMVTPDLSHEPEEPSPSTVSLVPSLFDPGLGCPQWGGRQRRRRRDGTSPGAVELLFEVVTLPCIFHSPFSLLINAPPLSLSHNQTHCPFSKSPGDLLTLPFSTVPLCALIFPSVTQK